jgi:hypothetical protein
LSASDEGRACFLTVAKSYDLLAGTIEEMTDKRLFRRPSGGPPRFSPRRFGILSAFKIIQPAEVVGHHAEAAIGWAEARASRLEVALYLRSPRTTTARVEVRACHTTRSG